MHQRNFIYLLNQLEKTGFGRGLESALKGAMQASTPGFELACQYQYGKHRNRIDVCLYFRRSVEGDYSFTRYHVILSDDYDRPLRKQTFYVDRPNTVTAKEAFNLLEGRPVYKAIYIKGELVDHQWLQLDFNQQEPGGNYAFKAWSKELQFDLESVLQKLGSWELGHAKPREFLLQSLKKGNLTDATFIEDGLEVKRWLHVKPWAGVIEPGDIVGSSHQLVMNLPPVQESKPAKKRKKKPLSNPLKNTNA